MSNTNDDRELILRELEPLFERAERENLWFHCFYQDVWLSPKELRDYHEKGRFIWSTVNWELRNPKERLTQLQNRVETAKEEAMEFAKKIGVVLSTILTILVFSFPALALTQVNGPVIALAISVTDGDTIKVKAYPWPSLIMEVGVRIHGIDTPERKSKCAEERRLAGDAKVALAKLIEGKVIILQRIEHDKFAGRVLAQVFFDGVDIGEAMIKSGFARKYDGKARQPWC